ncbi:xanthine dehydrogenase family protein subunit M [Alphaproteobacteria bacterium]|jgi:carbon-monoxide dehydrogenase medium subunit|nr:xanthine dehydrogenase family protein subunit M [Alphaproteobacteria bacterium]
MIPSAFNYHRPETVDGVVSLLAEWGDDARVIAGGHSLIPVMKQRLTDISHLIDLAAVETLKGISLQDGVVTIGAMTTQHELITSDTLAKAAPLVREASLQIADPQVRYVGTIGGNVANGDPANDMPGLMQTLDATYHLTGPNGARTVAARDFYEAAYFTAREEDEILTAISFAATDGGYAYEKQKRKIGDYATAAAGVLLTIEGGTCSAASIALTNLSDTPVYCAEAVDILVGSTLDDASIDAAVKAAVGASDPVADTRGPVDFKKYVAGIIIKKAIHSAKSRA